ncbi:hypothetical protein UFOVP33_34 [uncultured Caudovirales phage]|uniref:Uncharacterized protein n=1 Tax=uncultured Caudovirales phage TaxID=2100421 RepID=A0A6J5KN27_9CAUD|nr:hypothetical protein UFOVP33_34 [uncultured Caudovirales phage]
MRPYLTLAEVAEKEGISTRRLRVLCEEGRVFYADKINRVWFIFHNYRIDRKPVGRPPKKRSRWVNPPHP